ncbi:ATP-binding protein [Methylophilus sp. 5]|uniref:ATP-binding protein n=1 Tax=Methylophilus sp. 5 TaxID=1112274 RepID=UPI00048AAC7F|nr:ATP-binding protein [Methylophilus sp. 5]
MTSNSLLEYLGYSDNLLIMACGDILSDKDLASKLKYIPPVFPSGFDFTNNATLAAHYVESVRSIHIPSSESLAIAQAIDLMLRQGYVGRNPSAPTTWQGIYQNKSIGPPSLPAQAAYVTGLAGTGKSRSVERSMERYHQVVVHQSFPHLRTPLRQLVWLKVDVPPNGSARELAFALMRATDQALDTDLYRDHATSRKSGLELLNTWWDKARVHFLGMLVLDEASNLFKIETLKQRMKRKASDGRLHLRVADDETLKFIINLNNTAKLPLVMIGTPDGMEAFCARLSTVERLTTGGIYEVKRSTNDEGSFYRKYMFPALDQFRLGNQPVGGTGAIRDRLFELSAGIPRIYVSLWCLAARAMVSRKGKGLEVSDLEYVMQRYMSPLKAAISALLSDDPRQLAQYEDLLPPPEFWTNLFLNQTR